MTSPLKSRNLLRFSKLGMISIIAIALGSLVLQIGKERDRQTLVAELCRMGGNVGYDFETDAVARSDAHPEPPGNALMRRVFGDFSFAKVQWVSFKDGAGLSPELTSERFVTAMQSVVTLLPSSVDLAHTPADDTAVLVLSQLAHLNSLDVSHTHISGASVEHISRMTHLVSLTMEGTSISDDAVKHLASMRQLRVLWLNDTQISDGCTDVLQSLETLEVLCLKNTRITNVGLERLASMSAIRFLDLRGCDVSDSGINHLTRLKCVQQILISSGAATQVALQTLHETMPQTQFIEWPIHDSRNPREPFQDGVLPHR